MGNVMDWDDITVISGYYGRLYNRITAHLGGPNDPNSIMRYAILAKLYMRGGMDLITGNGNTPYTSNVTISKGTGNDTITVATGPISFDGTTVNVTGSDVQINAGDGAPDINGHLLSYGESYGCTVIVNDAGTVSIIRGEKAKTDHVVYPDPPGSRYAIIGFCRVDYNNGTPAIGDVIQSDNLAPFVGLQNSDDQMMLFRYAKDVADSLTTAQTDIISKISTAVNQINAHFQSNAGKNLRQYAWDNNKTFPKSFYPVYKIAQGSYPYTKMGQYAIASGANTGTWTAVTSGVLPGPSNIDVVATQDFNVATTINAWYVNDSISSTLAVSLTSGATTVTVSDTTDFPASGLAKVGDELIQYAAIPNAGLLSGVTRKMYNSVPSGVAHAFGDTLKICDVASVSISAGTVSGTVRPLGVSTSDIVYATSTHAAPTDASGVAIPASGIIIFRNN